MLRLPAALVAEDLGDAVARSASPRRGQLVRDNLLTLYAAAAEGFASPLPGFVRDELEGFISCAVLERGFAVSACPDCREQELSASAARADASAPRAEVAE